MANVYGPLMSVSASGSIAKTLCFKQGTRGTVCRRWAKPGGQPSIAQLAVQAFTKERMQHWASISSEDKATWDVISTERRVSPINCYLDFNWQWHNMGLELCDVYPYQPPVPEFIFLATAESGSFSGGNWDAEFSDDGSIEVTSSEIKTYSPETMINFGNLSPCEVECQFDFRDCTNIESVVLNTVMTSHIPIFNGLKYLSFISLLNCSFYSAVDLDAFLISLYASVEVMNGSVEFYGMGYPERTSASDVAVTQLTARGWTFVWE